uniref:Uncharacterized protein n=1 Tax=Cannabis sativa TaxID=3483 RepID=A0A803PIP9_CANSA
MWTRGETRECHVESGQATLGEENLTVRSTTAYLEGGARRTTKEKSCHAKGGEGEATGDKLHWAMDEWRSPRMGGSHGEEYGPVFGLISWAF